MAKRKDGLYTSEATTWVKTYLKFPKHRAFDVPRVLGRNYAQTGIWRCRIFSRTESADTAAKLHRFIFVALTPSFYGKPSMNGPAIPSPSATGRAPSTNNRGQCGHGHHAAVRALAFKWIRIATRTNSLTGIAETDIFPSGREPATSQQRRLLGHLDCFQVASALAKVFKKTPNLPAFSVSSASGVLRTETAGCAETHSRATPATGKRF